MGGRLAGKFRFHTGSIKSELSTAYVNIKTRFRFHTGSIKSWRRLRTSPMFSLVSIPYWFD